MNIQRQQTNQRMSQIVVHGDTVYLAGQVASDLSQGVQAQTQDILKKIESLLTKSGSTPQHILSALIHLDDMRHFEAVNEVWDKWVPQGHAPVRTCVEANMARPEILVEITVVAAKQL